VDAETTGINGIGALDAILAQQLVNVEFVQVAGAKNRVPVAGSVKYSGQAWVNDIEINAQDETESTYTIKLTGDGPLTKTTLAAGSGT
jgi:predicted secreted protein